MMASTVSVRTLRANGHVSRRTMASPLTSMSPLALGDVYGMYAYRFLLMSMNGRITFSNSSCTGLRKSRLMSSAARSDISNTAGMYAGSSAARPTSKRQ